MLCKVITDKKPIATPYKVIKQYVVEYVEFRGLDNIAGCTCKSVYEDYAAFCEQRGYEVATASLIGRRLHKAFPLITTVVKLNGKSVKVLVFDSTRFS